MTFNDLKLSAPLLKAVSEAGYETPSPIQASAIPPVLEGRDLMGCAQTGTGKTAAFALPMLDRLSAAAPRRKGAVRALILTPTRELALQIGESFDAYGKYLKLRSTVIFGGVGQAPQVEAIRKGVDILIACPGRLNDLIGQGHIDLSNLEVFVLDEADRMLDMGFVHDVKKVIAKLPAKRQNLMFSATMPKEIEQLAAGILHDPAFVKVDPVSSTVERIDQSLYFVEKGNKKFLLPWLIKNLTPPVQNALVFSRTKHGADKIARDLTKQGITAAAIHGNKSQTARVAALEGFKEGKTRVLVATDIAARGIDISELSHVFNYDLPEVPETYVHRIGRTGRAGQEGTAISFCDKSERPYLADNEKLTGIRIPVAGEIPHDESKDKEKLDRQRRASKASNRRRDTTSENASAEAVAEEAEREKQAKRKARTARAAASGKKPRREKEQVKKQEQQAKSAAPRASRSSHRRRDPYARFEKNEPRFDAHTPSRAYALSDEASERIRQKVEAALAARNERLLNGDKAENKPKKSARGGRSGRNGRGAHSKHPAQEAQAKTADAKPAAPRRHHRRRTPKKPQQQK